MTHTVQFFLTLVATVLISSVGLLVQAQKAQTDEDEMLVGLLILVALPIVLGVWYLRLRSEDPPIWWGLRQRLVGATGERLPLLEPDRANPFFPLPWFLLPMMYVFGSVGLFTEYRALLSVPFVATVGWVGLIGVYVVWWILSPRSVASSGLQRMLADLRQGPPAGGMVSPEGWVGTIFDRHRLTMDDATLETLYRAGLADAFGSSDRWPGMEVTRLQPWYARQGWLCILEERGLIPRDDSKHHRQTTVPEPIEGWQCPRCHTVNVSKARRCSLWQWEAKPGVLKMKGVCRTRRPGLSRVADLSFTIVEFAELLVGLVLFFAPFLLTPILVYGVLVLIGSGDPATLLAGIAFTIVWLVALRILPMGKDILWEELVFSLIVLGSVLLSPITGLANALGSVLRRDKRSDRRDGSG